MQAETKVKGFAALPYEVYERIFNYMREDLLALRDDFPGSYAIDVEGMLFLRSRRLVRFRILYKQRTTKSNVPCPCRNPYLSSADLRTLQLKQPSSTISD
jgi:hypothetical protein